MDVHLQEQWQNYEIRFCQLFPEGWGQKFTKVDPRRLYALHFRLPERQAHDVWIDDVAYMPHSAELDAQRCGPPCPRDAAPPEAIIVPNQFASVLVNAGLELHTFSQSTKSCGPLVRRYISYVPKRLQQRSDAAVIIALHGAGASAEAFRNYQTRGRFEALSERDGFILVYANAAPGPGTLGLLPNSGTWYVEPTPVDEVDDFAYLASIRDDLKAHQVISGNNKIFLVGHSIGAGMALATIQRNPVTYSGFAAIMPYLGTAPSLPTTATAAHLDRVFFAYSLVDPGLPTEYAGTLRNMIGNWATALGISANALATAVRVPLADNIKEGADYPGAFANATATRNSHAVRIDVTSSAKPSVALRVIEFDHAGHFWPNPTQDNMNLFVETWGLRNQDIDAADAVWEFFSAAGP
jgi:poly(3-hydroxybutyrate) depolymerase